MQYLAIVNYYALQIGGFIGLFAVAIWLVPKFARPGVRGIARSLVVVISGLLVAFALALPSIRDHTRSAAALSRLEKYCMNAGENIYSTATNVAGVMAYIPLASYGLYHEDDNTSNAYARLPWRRYEFFEATSHRPGAEGEVEYFTAVRHGWPAISRKERSANIAFVWTRLTSMEDQAEGLYGDETVIFDRVNHHVLARRTLYYFVRPPSGRNDGQITLCPGMKVGEDPNYIDRRPRDSYAFVSRVAQPPQLDQAAISSNFDLFPGSGRRTPNSCPYPIRASDDIRKEDVVLFRKNNDLIVELKTKNDAIICEEFFGTFEAAPTPGGNPRIRFSDGFIIYDHDVDRITKVSK